MWKRLLAVIAILQAPAALAQEFGQGAGSFSDRMRAGERKMEWLSLPSALDKQHALQERALGGIAGSAFQTTEATPDQTRRQLQVAPEPVFNYQEPSLGRFAAANEQGLFRGLQTFEFKVGQPNLPSGELFESKTSEMEEPLKLLKKHGRRGSLDKLMNFE